MTDKTFHIFQQSATPHDGIKKLYEAPPWRRFQHETATDVRAETYQPDAKTVEMVNTALCLRRPLLVTGKPGLGKTSLAYAVAWQLKLGEVLRWSISTQSTLKDGLYSYDAIGRLNDTALQKQQTPDSVEHTNIGHYVRLGPLGTAFVAQDTPRVLLIDEIDKSDIDLPNNLLHIFEEGQFDIAEVLRLPQAELPVFIETYDRREKIKTDGWIRCQQFPLVIMTSNNERAFPPAFLRRCLQLDITLPQEETEREQRLQQIVQAHFAPEYDQHKPLIDQLIKDFMQRLARHDDQLATDQLLNALHLLLQHRDPQQAYQNKKSLIDRLLESLGQ